jgi:hypothetical protein
LVPDNWTELPLNKGTGFRFLAPGRVPGANGYVEYVQGGSPGVQDPSGQLEPIHNGGDYLGVRVGGLRYWAAAEGNAVLDNPDANVLIAQQGSTGKMDISGEYYFGETEGEGEGGADGGGGGGE